MRNIEQKCTSTNNVTVFFSDKSVKLVLQWHCDTPWWKKLMVKRMTVVEFDCIDLLRHQHGLLTDPCATASRLHIITTFTIGEKYFVYVIRVGSLLSHMRKGG